MENLLKNTALSLVATSAIMLPTIANAEFTPGITGEIVVEWQNELTFDSDDKDNERNNSFGRMEIAPTVSITEQFSIDGVLVTEPLDQGAAKNPGDDLFFTSEGTFIEELKLNFTDGPYAIWAGKFNPGFGTAWDARGVWAEDFAEDYEITEKVGFGAGYNLETAEAGSHSFSANTFFNDTSFLSGSTITARNKAKKSDGGAGNTEDFSSFAASVDGENLGGIENLNYHVGFRHLAQGDVDTGSGFDDERGIVGGINYDFPVSNDLSLNVLGEFAGIQNFGGVKDTDQDYYTASVIATFQENWNVTLGHTRRDIDATGTASDFDDELYQATAGYDFQNGFTAEGGYRSEDAGGINSDAVGFLVRYTHGF